MFGSGRRKGDPGRTEPQKCSAWKAEEPIQAEQSLRNVRLGKQKSQFRPNPNVKSRGKRPERREKARKETGKARKETGKARKETGKAWKGADGDRKAEEENGGSG